MTFTDFRNESKQKGARAVEQTCGVDGKLFVWCQISIKPGCEKWISHDYNYGTTVNQNGQSRGVHTTNWSRSDRRHSETGHAMPPCQAKGVKNDTTTIIRRLLHCWAAAAGLSNTNVVKIIFSAGGLNIEMKRRRKPKENRAAFSFKFWRNGKARDQILLFARVYAFEVARLVRHRLDE